MDNDNNIFSRLDAFFKKYCTLKWLGFLAISAACLWIGIHFSIFIVLILGLGFILPTFLSLIFLIFFPEYDEEASSSSGGVGCFISIAVLLASLYFGLEESRYISQSNDKMHVLKDCPAIKNDSELCKISKLVGFCRFYFSDCDVCKEMKRKQDEEYRKNKTQNHMDHQRQELIEFYDDRIEWNQNKLDIITNCNDPDEMDKEYGYMMEHLNDY